VTLNELDTGEEAVIVSAAELSLGPLGFVQGKSVRKICSAWGIAAYRIIGHAAPIAMRFEVAKGVVIKLEGKQGDHNDYRRQ